MKRIKRLLTTKIWRMVNALALFLAIISVESTCVWVHHQPKVPEEFYKRKKFQRK